MGYYTSFEIEIHGATKDTQTEAFDQAEKGFKEMFETLFGEKALKTNLDDWGDYCFYVPDAKWYECETHMKKLSSFFPDVYFEVHGDGEEPDDFWISYFYKGKQQDGFMTVSVPFDPDKCLDRPLYYVEGAIAMLEQAGYGDAGRKITEMFHIAC